MAYGYAAQNVDPETTSKAVGREIPVKPKFAVNVCRALKGKTVKQARTFLEGVQEKTVAVPFRTHKRQVKHRKGGVGPGQYPVAVAHATLRILNDAASNAEYKGLDPETMYVWHACAHRGAPIPGFMPRAQGRATQWNKQTSHIEIVLKTAEEAEDKPEKGAKKGGKKGETAAKADAPAAEPAAETAEKKPKPKAPKAAPKASDAAKEE